MLNQPMKLKYLVLCSVLACTPTWAQMKYNDFKEFKGSVEGLGYVSGLVRGVVWANQIVGIETGKKLFCQPQKLSISPEMATVYIDTYAAKLTPENVEKMPMELMLIRSLQATFPC